MLDYSTVLNPDFNIYQVRWINTLICSVEPGYPSRVEVTAGDIPVT